MFFFACSCILQCTLCSSVSTVAGTCEPWWGRVRLDLVLGVVLDQVPQTPDELWLEDVKRLLGAEPTPLDVGREQVEVRILEPLKRTNKSVKWTL